ncbi:MAG TPA: cyclic nucleotide-binding domain-containing protein [Kofleriaceae bacterium]|nr:cyclic nucleotide-binding domain-containing protein [Kofleriaceae bacterium]
MSKADPRALRDEAQLALSKGRPRRALECYRALGELEPADGTWPHRAGELLQRLGEKTPAIASLRRAVELYARAGFLLKAVAVCKLILRIDPEVDDARQRLKELNSDRGIQVIPRMPMAEPDSALAAAVVEATAPREPAARAQPAPPPAADLDEIPLDIDIEFDAPELSVRARSALAQSALVAAVPPDQLGGFIDRCSLVQLAEGDVLFRQGDAGDALYVVVSGEVAVIADGPPRIELTRLGESSFFGEIALVTEETRTATVQATRPTELLVFKRAAVEELCAAEPALLSVILAAVRERLVNRLIATSPLFEPFAGEERRDLVGRFRCRDAPAGSVLIAQGRRADGLYVLLSGRAEVLRYDAAGAERVVSSIKPGDFVGEMSLLTGQAAVATVRTQTRALVLHLPTGAFREVIMTHPQVLALVGELAADRQSRLDELDRNREADGEYADFHVDLL